VKTITSGEGGMITTNSEDIYRKLLKLRSHGINKLNDSLVSNLYSKTKSLENPWYYEMQNLGYNYRLTDFQAVLGISQLKKVTKFINRRFDLASHYREEFKQFKNLQVAQKVASKYSANHIFPIRINFAQINLSKSELMVHLRKLGIMTQVHYIPIPLHPYYQMQNFNTKNIPEAMTYYYESLSIPLFPRLTNRVQARIIEILRKTIG
jgi:dTDP-4-amino-4,6-dideoxygalactose transaminase